MYKNPQKFFYIFLLHIFYKSTFSLRSFLVKIRSEMRIVRIARCVCLHVKSPFQAEYMVKHLKIQVHVAEWLGRWTTNRFFDPVGSIPNRK